MKIMRNNANLIGILLVRSISKYTLIDQKCKTFIYNAQKMTLYAILVGWYKLVIFHKMLKFIKNVNIFPRIVENCQFSAVSHNAQIL